MKDSDLLMIGGLGVLAVAITQIKPQLNINPSINLGEFPKIEWPKIQLPVITLPDTDPAISFGELVWLRRNPEPPKTTSLGFPNPVWQIWNYNYIIAAAKNWS